MKTTYSLFRRSFAAFLLTMGLMMTGNAVFAQTPDVPADTRTEVERLNHDIEKAVEKKDMAAIVELYSDDATMMIPGGKKIQGRKAIADYWYKMADAKSLKAPVSLKQPCASSSPPPARSAQPDARSKI